jgi:hypothetical protein
MQHMRAGSYQVEKNFQSQNQLNVQQTNSQQFMSSNNSETDKKRS